MDPTTCGLMALAALALLCCMRRRRPGSEVEAKRGGAEIAEGDAEEARARDEAFTQYNNFNEVP